MPELPSPKSASWFAFLALSLAIAGCSSSRGLTPQVPSEEDSAVTFPTKGAVYVSTADGIRVYSPQAAALLTTIKIGTNAPSAMTFDRFGVLYVANAASVTAYGPGKRTLLQTFTRGINTPQALAVRSSLYVANHAASSVTIYAPSSGKLQATITKGVHLPTAIAFDPSGNLYVADGAVGSFSSSQAPVEVYPPHASSPARRITIDGYYLNGVPYVRALATDSRGRLYASVTDISDYGSIAGRVAGSQVLAFRPGTSLVQFRFDPGRDAGLDDDDSGDFNTSTGDLAFDASGNLYVAASVCTGYNNSSSSYSTCTAYRGAVAEYDVRTRKAARIFTALFSPRSLAIDRAGTLYVLDCSDTTCTGSKGVLDVYPAGQTTPMRAVTINQPHNVVTEP